MKQYSVKELAGLSGVSVRTLHLYDEIGLLKPAVRTEARYRLYGEKELLKLQQILFYKELDFSLKEITDILDDPDFDLIVALENHKQALISKQQRISVILNTIEKTVLKLKGKVMLTHEELYSGLSSEEAKRIRQEAIEKYGRTKIEISENYLKKLTKEQLGLLKEEQKDIFKSLFNLSSEDPESDRVQKQVARHYKYIRKFWGTDVDSDTQAEAYAGLGNLYVSDDRFTKIDGKAQPEFAKFLSKAIAYFAKTNLK